MSLHEIGVVSRNTVPDSENSDRLLPEKKGLGVLNFQFVVLPLTVNTVILKHIGLHMTGKELGQTSTDLQHDREESRFAIITSRTKAERNEVTMYSVVMKGSLTATSSTSSLCRATLATSRPILPNPGTRERTEMRSRTRTADQVGEDISRDSTVDANLDLPHGSEVKLTSTR